jgi:hypothetical protein
MTADIRSAAITSLLLGYLGRLSSAGMGALATIKNATISLTRVDDNARQAELFFSGTQ